MKTQYDDKRKSMLLDYIDYLEGIKKEMWNDTKARYIFSVKYFLHHAEAISYKGALRFYKSNPVFISDNPHARDAINHFLQFRGVGRKGKQKEQTETITQPTHPLTNLQKEQKANFLLFISNEREYSQNTLDSYSESLKLFFRRYPEFSAENARRFIADLINQEKAPQTIRLRATALEKFGEYVKKPVKIKRPSYKRTLHTDNVPTEAEFIRINEYLKMNDPGMYFIVRILSTTGCRYSELIQLTYEQISEGSCTLLGKGSKYRQFYFTKELQQLAKGKAGFVCLNKYGRIMSDSGLRQRLHTVFRTINIDESKAHPHAFRHFFAKMYLKKTKDVVQLADFLGHGSVDTTRIYLRKSYDEQKKEINRVVTW